MRMSAFAAWATLASAFASVGAIVPAGAETLSAVPLSARFGLATAEDRLTGGDDRESLERRTETAGVQNPRTLGDWLFRDPRAPFSASVQGGGISGFRDASNGQSGFRFDEGIVGFGLDHRLGEHWLIGIGGGYGGGRALSDQGSVAKTTETANLTVAYEGGPLFLQADALWDWDNYDRIGVAGGRQPSGQAVGYAWGIGAKGGWLMEVGPLRLGPVGGLALSTAYVEGFDLTAKGVALAVSPQYRRRLTGEAGGEIQWTGLGSGVVAPRLQVTYQSEIDDHRRNAVISNGSPIAVLAPGDEPQGRLHLRTGLAGLITRGLTAGIDYQAWLGDGGTDHRLSADMHLAF